MRLVYVDDGVPALGTGFIKRACERRSVTFEPLDPMRFDYHPERQLRAGDLMYRPAVSFVAQRVEQFLYARGVSSFWSDIEGPYFGTTNPVLAFERAGLSVPRTIPIGTTDRDLLQSFVRQLGGLPVVLKLPGFSSGIGVIRLDTFAALYSTVDYIRSQGNVPQLCAYVDDAEHWRLVVVGDRVVASYRNRTDSDDFRTHASRDAAKDYDVPPPEGMAALAVGAVRALRVEFGGVDALAHPSGRLYLLEANFPCYFAQAQDVAGIDIAGAMLDHLVAKAARLGDEANARA